MEITEIITKEEYRENIARIQKIMPRVWTEEFIDEYFPERTKEQRQSIKRRLNAFMTGNSYITAISPPYFFWRRIQQFIIKKYGKIPD